jgi:hypothetical protein
VKSITSAAPAGVQVILEDDAGGVCFTDGPTRSNRNANFRAAQVMEDVSNLQAHGGDSKWRFSQAQVYKDGKSFYGKNLVGDDDSHFVWSEMIDKGQQPMIVNEEKQRDYCSKAMTLHALGKMSLRDMEVSLLNSPHPEWDAWKAAAGLNQDDSFSKLIRHFIKGHLGGPYPSEAECTRSVELYTFLVTLNQLRLPALRTMAEEWNTMSKSYIWIKKETDLLQKATCDDRYNMLHKLENGKYDLMTVQEQRNHLSHLGIMAPRKGSFRESENSE